MRDLKINPLRLGIIGCGSFVQRRILPILEEVYSIKVVAIQKRDLNEAKMIARKFNIPHATSQREELLCLPDVEAVFIASTNQRHEEDAIACAQAGKPTLCEKPLAPSSEEIGRMINAFKQNATPLCVGHSLRFKPFAHIAKELLQKGILGNLLSIRAQYCIPLSKENWRYEKKCGGGALQDLGIHLIDLIHFISEERIETVQAFANSEFKNEDQVEETVAALCRLSKGAIATFECSMQQPFHSRFEIIGSKSRLLSSNSLRQTYDPIESLCHVMPDDSRYYYPLKASNVFVDELKHFAECVTGQIPSIIPAKIGMQNQNVIQGAYHSIAQKREVAIQFLV